MNRAGDGMASPSRLHREGRLCLYTTSQSASQTAPLVGEPLAKPFTLRGLPKPPLGRSNSDDWRRMLGAATRPPCPKRKLPIPSTHRTTPRIAAHPARAGENHHHHTIRANKNAADGSEAVSGVLRLFSQQRSMDQALASLLCSAFL